MTIPDSNRQQGRPKQFKPILQTLHRGVDYDTFVRDVTVPVERLPPKREDSDLELRYGTWMK